MWHKLLVWLGIKKALPATLTAIYICSNAGEPMQLISHAKVEKNKGIVGDRYHQDSGFWKVLEACQVTLISQAELDLVIKRSRKTGLTQAINDGAHRRNLVINNVNSKQLMGKTFKIGDAVFRFKRPRPPCGYIDKVSAQGMCKALGKHSGCCIEVVSSGSIQLHDKLIVINSL